MTSCTCGLAGTFACKRCYNTIATDIPRNSVTTSTCTFVRDTMVGAKPKTNADRIRGLSDDGLEAEFWQIYKQLPSWTDSRAWLHQWLREESCE